jgi:hypothetical protein
MHKECRSELLAIEASFELGQSPSLSKGYQLGSESAARQRELL